MRQGVIQWWRFMWRAISNTGFAALIAVALLAVASFAEGLPCQLGEVKGDVAVLREGESDWGSAIEGMPLEMNDRIQTGAGASCTVELDDGSLLSIEENTEASVNFLELTEKKHTSQFSLFVGKVFASINKSRKTSMEIRTPVAVAAVRGTEFAVQTTPDSSDIGVFIGEVNVNNVEGNLNDEVVLKTDEETKVARNMKPSMPAGLQEAMLRNRGQMLKLRARVQSLKERLKRIPPQERLVARKAAVARFKAQRAKRQEQLRQIRDKRNSLRRKV